MKRVLFISSLYHPHVGGIETMITELSTFYHNEGIETISLTKKWPATLPESDEYKGINIFRVPSARTKEEFETIIDWVIENESKIKADIIHVLGIRRPLPLIGLLLARHWKVPLICTIAGGDIPDKIDPQPTKVWEEGQDFIPDVLSQSDCVTCVSKSLMQDLKELMPELNDLETLYAGMDFSIIQNSQEEKIEDQYLFSLRRLDPSKGIDVLIKAFNLIKDKFPKLSLVIAGEGGEESKLKQLVSDYSLGSRVKFLETVSLERGIALLKGAELTAVPSLSEGGGLVNIEAQAAGCPVIASRVGGIPEYVKDGESGLLFEGGNFQELADKISELLTNKTLRQKIIEGGYKHAQQFDWKVLVPKYIDLYKSVIKNHDKNKEFKSWSDLTKTLWNKLTKNMKDVEKAITEYSFEETSPVNLVRESSDNMVFSVGEKNKKILRISKRLPIEDIKFEYEAVRHLSSGGVSVPAWKETKDANFYTLIDDKVAVVFDFIDGSHIVVDKDHLPSSIQAYNAGKGLGLMSNTAAGFIPTSPRKRNIFSELERAVSISDKFINHFEGGKEFIDQVKNAIEFGKTQNEVAGFIHNDYRPSNVFFNLKDELTGIIDFDWSCIGPIIKDLALAIVEWSFPDGADEADFRIFDAFLDGYNSVANFKWQKNEKLYSWIKFATLSDASTYFCDLAEDPHSIKRIIRSYMYRKYLFFLKV